MANLNKCLDSLLSKESETCSKVSGSVPRDYVLEILHFVHQKQIESQ